MPEKRDVLFIQGGGEGAHHEDARLAASLGTALGASYEVRFPTMPNEASPDYAAWAPRLADELAASRDGAILVGHSLGAMMLVRLLAERTFEHNFGGIFLIATPFVGDGGWESEDFAPPASLAAKLPSRTPVFLYHGSDDEIVPFAHVDLYAAELPHAVVRRLPGRNHQLDNDMSAVADDIRTLG